MDLQIGSTVGDYQIIGVLGAGGMGSVYQVRSLISDRVEALKILLPDLAGNPDLAERFLREIKVLGSLEHPNIAQLRAAFRSNNQLLMVMEFVDGVTLEDKLKDGPLPVAQAVDAVSQILAALEFAHSRGVIHRDIKPANMILTKTGVVKLMDFGIAKAATDHKLTMTGTTMGSLYYMSPEQIQGAASLDARADLYSVGVTLYQLVTGKRPFDGDSQYAIMAAHLEKTPVPPVTLDPTLPRAINDVILMSVAKDPNARFQTAAAFRNALGGVAGTLKTPAPMYAPPTVTTPAATPSPVPFATAVPLAAPPMPPPAAVHPPAAAAAPRSHRGLWMAIGGIAVAAAIAGVIEFGPWRGAKADSPKPSVAAIQQSQPAATADAGAPQTQPPQAAPQPEQTPAATPMPASKPSVVPKTPVRPAEREAQPSPPAQVAAAQPAPVAAPQVQQTPPQQTPPPQPSGPSRAEILQAREHMAKLTVRANDVRQHLQTLKRSMQPQGLNARFTQPEGLMGAYLESANEALNQSDLPAAKEYADKAERQIEILEKLLNM